MLIDLEEHGFDATLVEVDKGVAKVKTDLAAEYVVLKASSGATLSRRVIFVAYENQHALLKEAEILKMRRYRRPDDVEGYDKAKAKMQTYLDPKIIKYEERKFFEAKNMEEYEGGTFESILSEAEISLCIYSIINNLQLTKSMTNLCNNLPLNLYPPMESETFIFYMLRYNYISEVVPLHSRGRSNPNHKDIFELTMKSYEAPVKEMREYYGEPIAIYFMW